MSHPLNEAELSCTSSLHLLEHLAGFPKEKMEEIQTTVTKLLRKIVSSKKKIMMRSAKGAALSEQVKKCALSLETKLTDLSQNQDSQVIHTLSDQLSELEVAVSNVTTYWRSFEAVLT